MRYKGKVYRPPSRGLQPHYQVTYGCSHNRCAFLRMYDDKHFSMRPMEEIGRILSWPAGLHRRWSGCF